MQQSAEIGTLLASISKHHLAGIIAVVVGVIVVGFGLLRSAMRVAFSVVGIVVVVLGILVFTRAI
jgi:type IV secretory pathway VirB2 component (pilin)